MFALRNARLGKLVPECLHSGSKNKGGGGDRDEM